DAWPRDYGWTPGPSSGQQTCQHVAVHVGQPALDAVVVERQALVIDAEQVQDGGVKIVDIDRVLGGLPADVVGRSVSDAVFQPGACQPDAEGVGIVVAPRAGLVAGAFGVGRAAELGV